MLRSLCGKAVRSSHFLLDLYTSEFESSRVASLAIGLKLLLLGDLTVAL